MAWLEEILAVWASSLVWWLGLCVAFLILTRLTPCNPGRNWWADRRAAVADFVYWLLMPLVSSVGRIAFLLLGVMLIYGRDASPDQFAARNYPLWCQCLVILLVQDVFLYWVHRLFHSRMLWKFHAVHHSSEVVDWTTASRFHPVNVIAEFALADSLILLMGFSPVALAILGPVNLILSALVHANLNWTFGPFRYLLASPVFHRWHHTSEEQGLDKNFASTFPFLDWMWGTFHMPTGQVPTTYGTLENSVPRGVIGQTLYPARGSWSFVKKHPVGALASLSVLIATGWVAWDEVQKFAETPANPAEVAAAVTPPELKEPGQLRLTEVERLPLATAVATSANSQRIMRGMSDGSAVLIDTTDGHEVARSQYRMRVNAVAMSPNGTLAVSASGDGLIKVLDCVTGKPRQTIGLSGKNPLCVAISDDGFLAAGTVDGIAGVWNPQGQLVQKQQTGPGAVHAIAISDGGKIVVTAKQSQVSAWNLEANTTSDFEGPRELVYCLAVRADGEVIAGGGYDGQLFVWNRASAKPRWNLAEHEGPIYSLAFAPDGQSIVTGGGDRTVRVWDIQRGALAQKLEGHAGPVFSVSLDSKTHRVLATGKDSSPSACVTRSQAIVPASAVEMPK